MSCKLRFSKLLLIPSCTKTYDPLNTLQGLPLRLWKGCEPPESWVWKASMLSSSHQQDLKDTSSKWTKMKTTLNYYCALKSWLRSIWVGAAWDGFQDRLEILRREILSKDNVIFPQRDRVTSCYFLKIVTINLLK